MHASRSQRRPVRHAATLVDGGQLRHGMLTDISIRGARFEGRRLPPGGGSVTVMIEVEGLRAPARVKWSKGDAVGLEFLEPKDALSLIQGLVR